MGLDSDFLLIDRRASSSSVALEAVEARGCSMKTASHFTELSVEDLERLQSFLPVRAVIRRHFDGTLEGLTEESWNMNWSDTRINIFWSGTAYSMLGESVLDAQADAQHNCKATSSPDLFTPTELVIDLMADDCPIAIDWSRWLNAKHKYDKRNAHFMIKGNTT